MRISSNALSLSLFGFGVTAVGAAAAYRSTKAPSTPVVRPDLVTGAIEKGENVYYFGVGSNLSRTKLENRSICGSKIHVISMEPAVIPDHRLAFNMRGFPPLEPGMGSLEPLDREGSEALHSYENEECHGALICLSADDYEKVYKSEGGGSGPTQGYEEIIVTCIPYDEDKPPVKAVAFRARDHVRLKKDPCPSLRYMKILREGARELKLKPCYQKWLADHPVQTTSMLLKKIAINNMICNMVIFSVIKSRIVSRIQSWLLFQVYVLPAEGCVKRIASEIASCAILFPGSCVGFFARPIMEMTGTMPPHMKRFIGMLNQ